MLEQVEQNVGAQPQAVSADSGFWNPEQVEKIQAQGIDLHVATSKQKQGETRQSADDHAIHSGEEILPFRPLPTRSAFQTMCSMQRAAFVE